jgi:hypothetical protein
MTAFGLIAPDPGPTPNSKTSAREFSSRIKDFMLMKLFKIFKG